MENWRKGLKRGVIAIPTGGGKTVTSMEIFRRTLANRPNWRMGFFTERRILAQQATLEALAYGLPAAIQMANVSDEMKLRGIRYNPTMPVQVCNWQTLEAADSCPDLDLVIFDEGHRWCSDNRRRKISSAYANSWQIFLTATPVLADGKSLAGIADYLVCPVTTSELIEQNVLVKSRLYYPDIKEIRGLDFIEDRNKIRSIIEKKMHKSNVFGSTISEWKQKCQGRPTLYFGSSVDDSKQMSIEFGREGIRAVHIDADTEDEQRIEWFEQFRAGEIKIICNYEVLTYGVDIREVGAVIIKRPTTSLSLLIQIMGRGIRAGEMPGLGKKTDCIFLDQSGTTLYHQYAPGVREIVWTLDPEDNVDIRNKKEAEADEGEMMIVCQRCGMPFKAKVPQCPDCGWVPVRKRKEKKVDSVEVGTLRELIRDGAAELPTGWEDKVRKDWVSIVYQCFFGGHTMGVAAQRFNARWGMFPWKFKFLPYLPDSKDWSKRVRDVFPGMNKRKKGS